MKGTSNMKKRIFIIALILMIILTACETKGKVDERAETLPFVIADETIKSEEHFKNVKAPEDEYKIYQEIKEIKVRDLTDEEIKYFLEVLKGENDKNLNNKYAIIEIDYGDVTLSLIHI